MYEASRYGYVTVEYYGIVYSLCLLLLRQFPRTTQIEFRNLNISLLNTQVDFTLLSLCNSSHAMHTYIENA